MGDDYCDYIPKLCSLNNAGNAEGVYGLSNATFANFANQRLSLVYGMCCVEANGTDAEAYLVERVKRLTHSPIGAMYQSTVVQTASCISRGYNVYLMADSCFAKAMIYVDTNATHLVELTSSETEVATTFAAEHDMTFEEAWVTYPACDAQFPSGEAEA